MFYCWGDEGSREPCLSGLLYYVVEWLKNNDAIRIKLFFHDSTTTISLKHHRFKDVSTMKLFSIHCLVFIAPCRQYQQ